MATKNNKDIGKLLKKYGYAMPLSEDEILAFEDKYGKDFESPSEWDSIDNIIKKDLSDSKEVIELNSHNDNKSIIPLSMAARDGKKISEEIRKKMNKDKKDAQK